LWEEEVGARRGEPAAEPPRERGKGLQDLLGTNRNLKIFLRALNVRAPPRDERRREMSAAER
jgi:hypothetical protein